MTERWLEKWHPKKISSACAGSLHGSFDHVTSVSTDTRTLEAGALFVALIGENFDGHHFVREAELRGAAAAVVSEPVDTDLPTIEVRDTLLSLQSLARLLFSEMQKEPLFGSVAITGSNGKTTTKEYIRALLGPGTFATKGNLNNHIGVPLTILDTPADTRFLVLEMGANRFGDIEELVSIAPTDVRVLTSIGAAHLEGFGDLDGVARAKSEIFDSGSVAILPTHLVPQLERLGCLPVNLKTTGETEGDLAYTRRPFRFLDQRGRVVTLHNPHVGPHYDQNLALAVLATEQLDSSVTPEELATRVRDVTLPGGRARTVQAGGHEIFDDAYNANPSSLFYSFRAWLEIVEQGERVPRLVIIGDMYELGDDAEALHRESARDLAQHPVDELAFVGEHSEAMKSEISDKPAHAFSSVEQATQWLADKEPSRVFLKGSRGMKLERIIQGLEP